MKKAKARMGYGRSLVAVTGSIASGKSTFLQKIASKNTPIFSCDEEIRKLYQNSKIINDIKKIIPNIIKDDKINKEVLLQKIFENHKILKKLESILYPSLKKEIQKFASYHRNAKTVYFEVPLLFEKNMSHLFDDIIVIIAPKKLRERRFKKKGGNMKLFRILNSLQFNEKKKSQFKEFIINGSPRKFTTLL